MHIQPLYPETGGTISSTDRKQLYRVARQLTGNADDAEDLVQETLLKWWALPEKPAENPGGYLMQMLINKSLNHRRDTQRRDRIRREIAPELTAGFQPAPVERSSEMALAVTALIEKLNPVERAVMVLKEAFSYSHKEIADMLGMREDHCRQVLSRARKRLRLPGARYEAGAEEKAELVARFAEAANGGNLSDLVELLARDAQTVLEPAASTLAGPVAVAQHFTALHRQGFTFSAVWTGTDTVLQLWQGATGVRQYVVDEDGATIRRLDPVLRAKGGDSSRLKSSQFTVGLWAWLLPIPIPQAEGLL